VLNPRRRAGLYVFDGRALYVAKVALFLKRALGTNTELLSEFTRALVERLGSLGNERSETIVIKSRPSPEGIAVEVKVPFRELARQVDERLEKVELYKDLPRGRRRSGWKREFLATMKEAAQNMGDVSPKEIQKAIREYRHEKKQTPEVTVETEPEAARA
jgi:hypothetical protein